MCQVNVFQAKSEFSKLIAMLENGDEDEIVIARNGVPAAKLIRWEKPDVKRRIGAAKGLFVVGDDFAVDDAAIERSFAGGES